MQHKPAHTHHVDLVAMSDFVLLIGDVALFHSRLLGRVWLNKFSKERENSVRMESNRQRTLIEDDYMLQHDQTQDFTQLITSIQETDLLNGFLSPFIEPLSSLLFSDQTTLCLRLSCFRAFGQLLSISPKLSSKYLSQLVQLTRQPQLRKDALCMSTLCDVL